MVVKGISTMMMATSVTSAVSGLRQLRSSTMLGRVLLPDTVTYCFLASTKSDRYRISSAISIRNTARPVASLRPWVPRP